MLWLALRFPELALEVFARGAPEPGPLAVASSRAAGATIIACNRSARDRGVRPGMPLAAACALASGLKVLARDAAHESAALARIAAWALQFTPAVSLSPPSEVLLEIEGSLRLFGGLGRLRARIGREIAALGYRAILACAPTALAAQLFARAGSPGTLRHRDTLRSALGRLPLGVLELPPESERLLAAIGARTLGDCLRLPRAGLARRLGPALLDALDRALGRVPDPRPIFTPPAAFRAALALPAPVDETQGLFFAARRLLGELAGFLRATGRGVQRLDLALEHEDCAPTRLVLQLAAASRDPEHLALLLRERLERTVLPCPATALALESGPLLPLLPRDLPLLPGARDPADSLARLVERLRARLGDDAVRGLDIAADHRPEHAWRSRGPGEERGARATAPPARPLWLLAAPRPLAEIAGVPHCRGPLALLCGPERIESGWWDGHEVARDYFVARDSDGALLWIYRECRGGGWYLHGFFG